MSDAPSIFDARALRLHRDRANEMLLQIEAASDVEERLEEVNKTFTRPAAVTPFPQTVSKIAGLQVPPDPTLKLGEAAHDLVLHHLCLHWCDDPVGQLIQCRRALEPDGLLIATAFGGETLTELRAALGAAEIEITGGLSPRIAPMGEIRDLGGLLGRAGLALPVADSVRLTLEYRDLQHLMHDLRAMGETNAMAARLRKPTRRAVFDRAEAIYRETYATGDRLPATFEIVTLTGWAPSVDQPKPLRRGSATHSLAEALKVPEHPLPRDD